MALSVIALVRLWRFTSLAAFTDPAQIIAWATHLKSVWWVPLLVVVAYTPASLVIFPRPVITLFSVIAFGPWQGCALEISGMLLAALVTYLVGSRMDQRAARQLAGPRFSPHHSRPEETRAHCYYRTSTRSSCPLRGRRSDRRSFRIHFLQFMVGTMLGLLPGALVATVFGDQITAALKDPSHVNFGILAMALVLLVGLTLFVKKWLSVSMAEAKRATAPWRCDAPWTM